MFKKRKRIIGLVILILLGVILFVVYRKLTTSKEPILNNKNYPFELDTIKITKARLLKNHATTAQLKQSFMQLIHKRVFPYWYGTKWNFNGTTQKPNEGTIACGYFVTTTLRDMGVPINRVKMAQCPSEEMIKSLTGKKHIHHLSGISLSEFEKKITKLGNGLYIIGLDNHTGFVSITSEGNFFIHASGWFPFMVVKDKMNESNVLAKSKYRVVGKISDDEEFLKMWIEGK